MDETEAEIPTAPVWVWIGLSVIACVSFWCQATVTEERFVPALNVVANTFNIPDDIAGATLMAAGASSPELFSSIVALFITHSALGLGTVSTFAFPLLFSLFHSLLEIGLLGIYFC